MYYVMWNIVFTFEYFNIICKLKLEVSTLKSNQPQLP
jgi:hypothetical protein